MRAGPKPQPPAETLPALKARRPELRVLEFFETHLRHTAGALAGQPLKLAPWQRNEIIKPLFGTIRPDGLRRYRSAFVTMPRRNGKSSLAAGIALYLLFADDEPGSYVVSAAANREQARVVFDQAAKMVEASPALSAMCQVYRSEIVIPSTGSRYKVLSRDSKVQHGMDLHGAVIDELHAHRDADLFRVLTSSTGSRRQPLIFTITTASDDEHSIASEVYHYAEQVRDGIIPDETLLSVMYSAPEDADPWDEAVWRQCNPALRSGFRSLDEMRTAALQARAVPAREASFRQLYLNQWGAVSAERWLPLEAWEGCTGPTPWVEMPAALAGRRGWLGLDLSSTTDLTALVGVFPGEDGEVDVLARFWAPEEKLKERVHRDRVPYDLWAQQGALELTPGRVVDYSRIRAVVNEWASRYDLAEVCFDPWNATGLVTQLQEDGAECVEIRQGFGSLSAPTKELERLVVSRSLRHGGHPVLGWCAANVMVRSDPAGNLKPDKSKSTDRIDGIVALVTALARSSVGAMDTFREAIIV